ncbi:MAG TPA: tripartite tricarboxylate transporter substrate-binding protein, partial [Burkholderiales bacterium]|nr:tripartite tricarboxylate transporter substrate-binding protein [Burkholderiales bacterium]
MMKRLLSASVVIVACAISAPGAWAQAYPVKPVRVVIPWPPGGSNDVVGRLVLQKLAQTMGQQFVVDNRAGAAGSIGAEVVAKSAPDGYTLMVHSTTHLGNGTLYKNLPYD